MRSTTGARRSLRDPALPPSLEGLDAKSEHYEEMETDYGAFKEYLVRKY